MRAFPIVRSRISDSNIYEHPLARRKSDKSKRLIVVPHRVGSILSSVGIICGLRLRLRSSRVYQFRYRTPILAFAIFFFFSMCILWFYFSILLRLFVIATAKPPVCFVTGQLIVHERSPRTCFLSLSLSLCVSLSIIMPRNNKYSLIENDLWIDATMYGIFSRDIIYLCYRK